MEQMKIFNNKKWTKKKKKKQKWTIATDKNMNTSHTHKWTKGRNKHMYYV